MKSRLVAVAAALTAGAAALTLSAAPASAAGNLWSADQSWVGERAEICAQDVEVRDAPGAAGYDWLYQHETIRIDQVSGDWVHGFAYGHINANAWIENGWFCP